VTLKFVAYTINIVNNTFRSINVTFRRIISNFKVMPKFVPSLTNGVYNYNMFIVKPILCPRTIFTIKANYYGIPPIKHLTGLIETNFNAPFQIRLVHFIKEKNYYILTKALS
jgi:hypothetical protein